MFDKYLFWFEELGQGHSDLVGKKCANLGEINRLGLPVPPGFALSVEAYKFFMAETNAAEEIRKYIKANFREGLKTIVQFNEASREIRKIVEGKEIPEIMKKMILLYYKDLCQKCDNDNIAVSTRSAGPVSHPGQYETHLNVKGKYELLEKVKKVWSSSFNPRSLAFRAQKGLPLESDPIGIAVLKMVNARAAGVLFTADPNTGDASRAIVEANWGLGESVVGGEVLPDIYIIDKESGAVTNKTLGQKTKYVACSELGVIEAVTPEEKSLNFCLSDQELQEIVKLGQVLERHFGVPQDVEWAIDQDLAFPNNIILLQTRPEIVLKKKPVDQVLDYMMNLF